jgi:hypothetical protein
VCVKSLLKSGECVDPLATAIFSLGLILNPYRDTYRVQCARPRTLKTTFDNCNINPRPFENNYRKSPPQRMKGGPSPNNALRSVTYRPRTHFTEITLIILFLFRRSQFYSITTSPMANGRPASSPTDAKECCQSGGFSIVFGDVPFHNRGWRSAALQLLSSKLSGPLLCVNKLPSSSRIAAKNLQRPLRIG